MMARHACRCHVAVLSIHASPPSDPPRFSCAYPFLIRFSRAVLEVLWCSKWVMQHIFGKLSTSSFQRYKVCMNLSSDERVTAPGSRGAGTIFVCFSGKDSGRNGGCFRRTESSTSYLESLSFQRTRARGSNCCELERLCARRRLFGRKNAFYSQRVFPQILSQFTRVFDLAPDVGFRRSLVPSKILRCLLLQGSGFAGIRAWTCEIWSPRTEATGVFLVRWRTFFRSGFRLDPVNSWRSESSTSCMNVSSFQRAQGSRINLLRVRKTLRASVTTSAGKFRNFQHSLISSACFHARGRHSSRCRILTILVSSESLCYLFSKGTGLARSFDHNSLVSHPFSARKVLNRSSRHALQNGQGAVNPIQLSAWSKSGWKRLGQTLVNPGQTWSTLVKLGQTSGNVSRTFFLGLFDVASPCRIRPAWFGLSRFACRHPRKSRGKKWGYDKQLRVARKAMQIVEDGIWNLLWEIMYS
uniref:Uncharacterized protein n=1 Tax=Fagus sylvatica TaxID=28930 RepID=A0A2N9G5N0_FAGSY